MEMNMRRQSDVIFRHRLRNFTLRQISGGILEKTQKVIQEEAVVCWTTKEMYILYKFH